jgi:fused signal recognition particle receptor
VSVFTLVIVVAVAAIVIFAGLGIFLLTPRRRLVRPESVAPPEDAATPIAPPGPVGSPPAPAATAGPPVAVPSRATPPAPPVGAPAVAMARPGADVLPLAGRMVRLRSRLSRSESTLGRGLLSLLSRDELTEDDWEDVEATLIAADIGVASTAELVAGLRTSVAVLGARTPDQVRLLLREHLLAAVDGGLDRTLHTGRDGEPAIVLMVGVNGTGKTTTSGKLGRALAAEGKTVLLGAADTFRAAAADQLVTWGERVGAPVVRGAEGADPASVAYESVNQAQQRGIDTVIIDTAGRLHTKSGLMDELGKVKRVVERQHPVDEVLLVLDATTGQNGLVQAKVFAEVVDVSGIVLTKLDGTAKGGIVVAVQRELGVAVKLVGLGEGPDDLAPFEPEVFVDALLGVQPAS